jgi:hypothetical protein
MGSDVDHAVFSEKAFSQRVQGCYCEEANEAYPPLSSASTPQRKKMELFHKNDGFNIIYYAAVIRHPTNQECFEVYRCSGESLNGMSSLG